MDAKKIKCVVVGAPGSGKTSLIISYATKAFPSDKECHPTVAENQEVPVSGEKPVVLRLQDTAGSQDYKKVRPLSYLKTDVFLVCFSVVPPDSFEDLKFKWIPEITQYSSGAPFLLVGTKIDLRDKAEGTNGGAFISKDQGEKMAEELKAAKYVECSALTKEGLNSVFEEAIAVAMQSE